MTDTKQDPVVDGLDDLASDVLGEDRYCSCGNRLQPGDLIYCKKCSEEING